MMRNILNLMWIVVAILLASACNNDIFIDTSDLPEATDVTLGGDRDGWSVAYSDKGLNKVVFEYPSCDKEYVRYEDKTGATVGPDCPPSELGAIVYDNPLRSFSISFYGEMIYIRLLHNSSAADDFTLLLEYDYGAMKRIDVHIEAGAPLELTYWRPTGDLVIKENTGSISRSASLTNNSPEMQGLVIRPYSYVSCSHSVIPAESWADGMVLTLPMLEYNSGDWHWAEYKDVELGAEEQIDCPGILFDETIDVEVPPFSKARIVFTVYKSEASQSGILQFSNGTDENVREVEVTWSSAYPTRYEYTVEYE